MLLLHVDLTLCLISTAAPKIFMDISADDLLSIRVGTPFKIPATITGRSVPKVTWEFDGKAKTEKKDRLHVLPVDSQVTFLRQRQVF